MGVTFNDINDFIESWREKSNISDDRQLTNEEITCFIGELQKLISKMDFSLIKDTGTTIIGYSGWGNDVPCWKIVDNVVNGINDSGGIYISSLPAGELIGINRDDLTDLIYDYS